MATVALEGAAMQLGMELVSKGIWNAGASVYRGLSGSDCKKLEQIVNTMSPVVKDICESPSASLPNSSLQKFPKFQEKIVESNQMVEEYRKSRNPVRKIQINERIKKLDKSINKFIQNDLQIVMLHAQAYLCSGLETVRDEVEAVRKGVEDVRGGVQTMQNAAGNVCGRVESVGEAVEIARDRVETRLQRLHEELEDVRNLKYKNPVQDDRSLEDDSLCSAPEPPSEFLGFDQHIMNLKKFLLEDEFNVVGVTAMGGAGKSTLAKAVCKDDNIREHFNDRVIYIVASERPDPLSILKEMWRNIVGVKEPHFTNEEDAHNKLESQIKSIKKPTLVVLDDIWSKPHQLLFEEKDYKTLITTRDKEVIPKGPKTQIYYLPLLQPNYALSLFCLCAFDQTSIPTDRDEELVTKVQQECNGLPLALKVIGSSLYGEPHLVWVQAEKRLSAGESFKDDHKYSVLNKLKTSIDVLEADEKDCFLNLGAFPQRKDIPAKALLDIWVYVRGMDSDKADMLVWKFAERHLLDLKKNPGAAENTDYCMDAYSFTQHDVMRDLALYLANQDNGARCRRLFMPKMKNGFPPKWEADRVRSSKAQIVSIHTGAMKDTDWPKMEFPEVEGLVLYFSATEYCIPTFLHTMKNLKVLIIHNNDGAKRSMLSGVAAFQELSQLKALHLEKLIVPAECKFLKGLEKVYTSLCEGLGRDITFNSSGLLEFNVSYSKDLEELPAGLCSSVSLKTLSVTHCHRLAKLPEELEKLESVKEIRLCESLGLKALPSSICSLKKLKLLDISSCKQLKANRGARCQLQEILQTLAKLPSLKRVICDKKNEWLFESRSRTDLKVQAVEEKEPNLDWLELEGRKVEF